MQGRRKSGLKKKSPKKRSRMLGHGAVVGDLGGPTRASGRLIELSIPERQLFDYLAAAPESDRYELALVANREVLDSLVAKGLISFPKVDLPIVEGASVKPEDILRVIRELRKEHATDTFLKR